MRKPFERVRGGDPLDVHHREYNAFIDAAVRDEAIDGGDLFDRAISTASRRVMLFNGSGSTIPAGEIRKLGAPSFTSGDHYESYTFEAVAIDAANDRGFVYLPNPIEDDTYGSVIVGGIAYAPVNVGHESHDRCDVGTATQLASGFSGHARILYKPAGTGVLNCVIDIGEIDYGKVKAVADATIPTDGSAAASVHRNGSDTGANVTAYLNWTHGDEDISAGKQITVEWFSDERKWVVVNADCEG